MPKHRVTLRLAGFLVILALPAVVQASVLTFWFEGHITNKTDPLNLLTFGGVNSNGLYTFSFDSDSIGTKPVPTLAIYSGVSSNLKVDATQCAAGIPSIDIQHPHDYFGVSSIIDVNLPGLLASGYPSFTLADQLESNALNSVELPTTPYDLAPFNNREFALSFYAPSPSGGSAILLSLDGQIDKFVPEPCSLLGVLAASAFLTHRKVRELSHTLICVTEDQPC